MNYFLTVTLVAHTTKETIDTRAHQSKTFFASKDSIIARNWKQYTCPKRWMDHESIIYYTVECYSAVKNEIMNFTSKLIDLERNMVLILL